MSRWEQTDLVGDREYLLIEDPVLRRKEYKKWWDKQDRAKNPEKVRERFRKIYRRDNPEKPPKIYTREFSLWRSAKTTARRKNKDFNIDIDDIVIPEICPVLKVPIDITAKRSYCSPSIDRIDPSKGYIKGNIQIISWRANLLKNDMTVGECRKLLTHLEQIENG